ncbi:MAG: glycogen synthase [Muribaculaceae bacterium]|nr:glycogen synthase [Muribaculaceae bacterium]
MESKKILFISQEVSPYVPDTSMSLLGRDIPQSVHGKEFEVRIFTPKYSCINERRNQLHEVIRLSGMNIIIDDNDHPLIIKVATLLPSRMQVYFIDNDDYFHPLPDKGLEISVLPEDNDERLMFFTTGVIETVKKLRWPPAVIHCSGWISALSPMVIRRQYGDDPTFRDTKIIYALQPEKFDGTLDPRFVEKLEMNEFAADDLAPLKDSPVDFATLNRLAMDHADAILQVTDDVDPELLEYARKTGKPFLSIAGEENRKEILSDFYRTLIGEEEE